MEPAPAVTAVAGKIAFSSAFFKENFAALIQAETLVYFEIQEKSIYFTLLILITSHPYSVMCNFHPAGRFQDQALILQQLKQYRYVYTGSQCHKHLYPD